MTIKWVKVDPLVMNGEPFCYGSRITVRQLLETGLVKDLADLYRLTPIDLAGLEGFAEKSIDNLMRAIEASKRPRLDRFLFALGIEHVGSTIARLLADHFGHPAPALAAYNAGPAAAAAWARDLAGLPLDEWVEDLPFRETRRYVKSVLADAGLRRWLYGSGDLSIDGLATPPPPGEGVAF